MRKTWSMLSLSTALTALLAVAGVAWSQPRIVVSIHPIYDLTQRIAGPDANVVRLLPPGTSPHGFDPTPSVVADVERADLLVLVGGIDEWAHGLTPGGDGGPVVFELLPLFVDLEALLTSAADHDDREAGEEEHADHGGVNPHIWLDPVLMERAVMAIGEQLAQLDPDRADRYRANAADLAAGLRALNDELTVILDPVRGAPFVPFHDAWPYFAARYGLDLVLEIEPFPGREPSPRYLADVVATIRSTGARAVFSETQLADRPARVIAQEAGVAVLALDPIGGTPGLSTYEELLRHNARIVAEGLSAP